MNIKKEMINLKEKGFFHIISSDIFNKIMQFSSGIFIIRVLSIQEYGVFTYAQNLLNFFILINGFGITTGFLQYGSKSECEEEKNMYIKYSLKRIVISNFLIIILIVLYSNFGVFKIEKARLIFKMMVLIPFFSIIFELGQLKNRIDRDNKKFAKNSNASIFLINITIISNPVLFFLL